MSVMARSRLLPRGYKREVQVANRAALPRLC